MHRENDPGPKQNVSGERPAREGGTLDRLLASPSDLVSRMLGDPDESGTVLRVAALSLLGFVLYGAAMGSFQGGGQIVRSMFKAPLVVAASLLLCLPSLYVFTGLSAGGTTLRRVAVTATTYAAMLAAVLVALVPISWLFSTVSSHIWFVGVIHFFAWCLALLLAHHVLGNASEHQGPALLFTLFLWSGLLLVVSLQMSTHLRPLLWQEPDAPLFETERKFFLRHYDDMGSWKAPEKEP